MAQTYLLALTLMIVASMTPRVIHSVLSRSPRGLPRQNPKSLLMLTSIMMRCRAQPRITILTPRMTFNFDKSKHKSRSRFLPASSGEDHSLEHRHRSPKPSGKSLPDQENPQHDPDPPYYREVALSDIPSQYAEEVDTFRRILRLPDPRDSLPRSSTAVMGLDDEKGRQELRPRGPSSMLPLNSLRTPFINLIRTSRQQIYLRVSTSKPLPPLPSR